MPLLLLWRRWFLKHLLNNTPTGDVLDSSPIYLMDCE
jgi:hypothetical protein